MTVHTGRRTKWLSLALWLVLAFAAAPLAGKLESVVNSDAATWLPKTAGTTRALERAASAFPGSDRLVAVVVYERPAGLTAADGVAIEADRAAFAALARSRRHST